ncbi:acyltransferase [Legionella genomosp. 1]|uniref:acyltransferase n=1 Tax=Legionella genomosp. 1 TaxID=1093625 RepID=UPI0010559C41|nr:acyltransferase [Legionella genomosp. 1]
MGYLSQNQLEAMNFKKLGKNVKISDKACIYNPEQTEIGDYTRVDDFCVISGKIAMGTYVHVAAFCLLGGGTEGIFIGDYSGVSYGSQVFSQSDDYSGEYLYSPLVPKEYKNEYKAKVIINRFVMIGASAVIFPGVSIGEGCSIGAMSLVTKNTDPWGVYIGIPVKRVKEKSRNVLLLEKKFREENPV